MTAIDNKATRVTKLFRLCLRDGRPKYQIAASLGIPAPRLSEYVHGKASIPMRYIPRFCEYFRVDPENLVGWTDDFAA